jgi:hypothetical protein
LHDERGFFFAFLRRVSSHRTMGCGASSDGDKEARLSSIEAAEPTVEEEKEKKPATKDDELLGDENALNKTTHKLVDDVFVESNAPLSVDDVAERLYLACDGETQEALQLADVVRVAQGLFPSPTSGDSQWVDPAQLEATLLKELGGEIKDIASYLRTQTHSHADDDERSIQARLTKELPPMPVDWIAREASKVQQLKDLILRDVGVYTSKAEAKVGAGAEDEPGQQQQQQTAPRRVVCVHGASGVGKTILCSSVISSPDVSRRFRSSLDGEGLLGAGLPTICWLNVGLFTSAYSLLRHVDLKLGGDRDFEEDDAEEYLLQTYGTTDCLLVMDDVVDKYVIRDVCRTVPRGFTVVVTMDSDNRERIFGNQFAAVDYMDIGLMTDDEVHRYVGETHGGMKDLDPEHTNISMDLAEACHRNFYAFSMICNSGKTTLAEMASLIPRVHASIAMLKSEAKTGLGSKHALMLAGAFNVAFERLPTAIQEMYLDLSVFQDEVNIPCELLQHWWRDRLAAADYSFHGVLTLLLTRCFAVYVADHTIQLHSQQRISVRRHASQKPPGNEHGK